MDEAEASLIAPGGAFFRRDGDLFVPTERARGPWNPDSLHGRVLAGLFGRCLEEAYGDDAFQFTRLTIDMFRLPNRSPIQVTTELIREGNRIRVGDAVAVSEGIEVGRARGVLLKRTEEPENNPVWKPAPWDAPHPDQAGEPELSLEGMWDTWRLPPGKSGQPRVWLRERHRLVEGEELTPFVRVAGCADFASPLANMGANGLDYVNADITLYLHRLPVGEYVGFETSSHESADGIAVADTTVYDLEGPIGRSLVCAVVNRRITVS